MPPFPLVALVLLGSSAGGGTASFDWVSTGTDCSLFACGDLDQDDYGDVVTINGAHQLCVALSVNGWKASPWKVILEKVPDDVVGLEIVWGTRDLHLGLLDLIREQPIGCCVVQSTPITYY